MKNINKIFALSLLSTFAACGGSGGSGGSSNDIYNVKMTNLSSSSEFSISNGQKTGAIFSPLIVVVHNGDNPIFKNGQLAFDNGLEEFVEDLDTSKILTNLQKQNGVKLIGLGSTPVGNDVTQTLLSGESYLVNIRAEDGDRVSVISGFSLSNDTFYANGDNGELLSDILNNNGVVQMGVFDLGTEANEPIAKGRNQVLVQTQPGQGTDENSVIANSNVVSPGLISVSISR